MMLLGAAINILYPFASLCIFGTGVLMFTLMQIRAEYEGRDLTIMRLRRQKLVGCFCFVLSLMLMSMQVNKWGPCRRNEWVVALAIGCVLQLYTAFRLPKELDK